MRLATLALMALAFAACGDKAPPADAVTVVLVVEGMTCENCVAHVTHDLAAFDGVYTVEVDLESGLATCGVDKSLDPVALANAVTGEYKVGPKP